MTNRRTRSRDDVLLDISAEDLAAALEFDASPPAAITQRRRQSRVGYGQHGVVRLRGSAWRLQYRGEPDADGRRRQHSVRLGDRETMTREQARAAATRMIEHIMPRRIPPGASCRWEDWCARYVEVYVPLLRHSSQQSTASVIRKHLAPAFAGLHLHEVCVSRIQTWIARQRAQQAAPSSITTRYRVLRRMLRRARIEGFVVELPSGADVDLPRSEDVDANPKRRAFTTAELQQILAAASEPLRTIAMFCAFCGLRISEALGVRWSDIDLNAGRLRIVRQGLAGREVRPKTMGSVAERRIPPNLVEHLQAFGTHRAAPDALLFPGPTGRPLHSSGLRKHHLRPLLQRLGIRGRSFHGLRHWLGSTAVREGVPVPAVQRLLRHKDRRSTEVYLGVQTDDIDAAIDGIESRYLQSARNVVSAEERRNDLEQENSP